MRETYFPVTCERDSALSQARRPWRFRRESPARPRLAFAPKEGFIARSMRERIILRTSGSRGREDETYAVQLAWDVPDEIGPETEEEIAAQPEKQD